MSDRFNNNNTELNKKRFVETNANIFKGKNLKSKKSKGAKFVNSEI